jgi:hypothetical protein
MPLIRGRLVERLPPEKSRLCKVRLFAITRLWRSSRRKAHVRDEKARIFLKWDF